MLGTTSKFLKAILMTAYAAAEVLRAAMKLDYRSLQAFLVHCFDFRDYIGL